VAQGAQKVAAPNQKPSHDNAKPPDKKSISKTDKGDCGGSLKGVSCGGVKSDRRQSQRLRTRGLRHQLQRAAEAAPLRRAQVRFITTGASPLISTCRAAIVTFKAADKAFCRAAGPHVEP